MEPESATLEILRSIRDEVRTTNDEVRKTNEEVRKTNERLDNVDERLNGLEETVDRTGERIVESEIRTATAIADLSGVVHQLADYLKSQSDLRPRVENCEREIEALKRLRPLLEALRRAGGNQTDAARRLKMPRRTFIDRMNKLKLKKLGDGSAD